MNNNRLYFLDFLRGLLLLIMIFYHYTFNLSYFFDYPINLDAFFLKIIPPVFSSCFLLVSGYSSVLSRNVAKRGLYVFFWATVVTLVTFIITPEAPVFFGILHCIGIMMIIAHFLKNIPDVLLLISPILVFIIDFLIKDLSVNYNYLLFLGITSNSFTSLDYYPLIPHGAFFLFGIFLGRNFKPDFLYKKLENKIGEALTFAGKNSLKVYLLHQPLFFAIYYFIKMI